MGPLSTPGSIPRQRTQSASKLTRLSPRGFSRRPSGSSSLSCESPLLSAFYHRPIKHRAAVILPAGEARRKDLPRFTSFPASAAIITWRGCSWRTSRRSYARDLVRVILDPDCGTGHHVFADSATNGPRGRALIEEFIPYLEKTFPLVADPRPAAERSLLGRLEQPLAASDLPELLRRHLVHQPRSGRLS